MAAVDPSAVAFRISARRRAVSAVPVVVVGDDAQDISLPDDSVDAALSTWNLCGLGDPAAALREVSRVLKPGGLLHFVEHGLAPDERVARSQRRGSAINKRIAGCFLDRDIRGLLEGSEVVGGLLDHLLRGEGAQAGRVLLRGSRSGLIPAVGSGIRTSPTRDRGQT